MATGGEGVACIVVGSCPSPRPAGEIVRCCGDGAAGVGHGLMGVFPCGL
jgi:hypothetical protein